MKILVLGTVALDTIKTPQGIRKQILGGSAVHFAMAARLFAKVHLVSVVGSDFPSKYIDFLNKKGINLNALIKTRGKTFRWEGEYKSNLNTAITLNTELGVCSDFRPCISRDQRKIKHIFLANVDPDIQRDLLQRVKSARLIGLDSMNYWINHKYNSLLRLLKKVDIYVANEEEARSLSQEYNLIKAAKALYRLGPRMVLIKKGEHGALFFSGSFIFSLPAYPSDKVVDPTGAGDTFAGGFMGYLCCAKNITKNTLKEAVAVGNVCASFNIEDFGLNKTARVGLEDLKNRLNKFKKMVLF